MSLPYYPMYPRDFFEGTQEMSLEQKGAYIMVLNLMYTRGGPISDEPGFVSRYVGCSVKKWKVVREELVAMGKLVVQDGMICNSRADQELEKQRSYQDQKSENRSRPNKNKAEESRPREEPKSEPKPEPAIADLIRAGANDYVGVEGDDLDLLEANCRKWANGSLVDRAGPLVLAPIMRLLKPAAGGEPCTMEDVRDGITKAAASLHRRGERVGLAYFEKPILSARDARLKPLPAPELSNETAAVSRIDGSGQVAGTSRPGNHAGGSRAQGAGGQPRSGNLATSAAWLRRMREEAAGVPDQSEDGRDDWVA